MHFSAILTLLGASLAIASPVHQNLHKKAIVYDIVTDVVYVTITEGELPSTSSTPDITIVIPSTIYVAPIEPTTPVVMVLSSTSELPVPIPTTSDIPSTTEAPPAPTSTEVPPAAATTEVIPVVTPTPTPTPELVVLSTSPAAAATTAQFEPKVVDAAAPTAPTDGVSNNAISGHNAHRSIHQVGNLVWNDTQATYAQNIADKCVMVHDMSQGGGGYGQNLASWGSSESGATDNPTAMSNAIADWYGEISLFAGDYGQENPSYPSTGEWLHFTQLVWKGSTSVGCAVASCGTDQTIFPGTYAWLTVCNYWPAGNYVGEYAQNVFPPS